MVSSDLLTLALVLLVPSPAGSRPSAAPRGAGRRPTAPSRSTACASSTARPGPKDAPHVLLLHGFPTSSHMFRNLIPALADRFHVVAPDYPGFGHSSMPARGRVRLHLRQPGRRDRRVHRSASGWTATRSTSRTTAPRSASAWRSSTRSGCTRSSCRTATPTTRGSHDFWKPIKAYWKDPTGEPPSGAASRLLDLEGDEVAVHRTASRRPERISPDAWLVDQALLDRPGNEEIQLAAVPQLRHQPAAVPGVAGVLPQAPAADADRLGQERPDLPGRGRAAVQARPEGRSSSTCSTPATSPSKRTATIARLMRRSSSGRCRNADACGSVARLPQRCVG